MADVTPILINQLAAQTTLSDSDYFIVGGSDAKKITVAQMKEALGINALNGNLQSRSSSILIPANNGDIYSSERNLYYDEVKITNKINWTFIIEASTDGTGNPTYVRYILSRTLLQLMDTVGEGNNVPRIRINSAGDVNVLMSGETNQDYYVHVNITRL